MVLFPDQMDSRSVSRESLLTNEMELIPVTPVKII